MIFRNSLLSHLDREERVEADDGYLGEAPEFVKCPASFTNPEETLFMQQRVRNRQDIQNKNSVVCINIIQFMFKFWYLGLSYFHLSIFRSRLWQINNKHYVFQQLMIAGRRSL